VNRREVIEAIIADCENDMKAMDGQPLTGANVAKWFAETLATMQALAKVVKTLLPEETHDEKVRAAFEEVLDRHAGVFERLEEL
jgi:hypothetical protein